MSNSKQENQQNKRKEGQLPLVSVIVAIYNIRSYLPRCIDSLLAQDYEALELLLVDDGSTDGCATMCDEYAKRDSRIQVIHKENGGLSDARNAGLAVAKGDYIGFVDGDDWIAPTMYRTMVQSCEENQAQIAVCRYDNYAENLAENTVELLPWDEALPTGQITVLSRQEAYEQFISAYACYPIHNSVWSKLYARKVCEGILFPVGKNSEDIMYTTRTFWQAERIAFVDTALYHYVIGRTGSIMNVGLFERRLEQELSFWREQEQFLRQRGEAKLADQSLFYASRRYLFYYREAVAYEKQQQKASYADKLARAVREKKKQLRQISRASWVHRGDRIRMGLFLTSPKAFQLFCTLFDRFIIPIVNQEVRGNGRKERKETTH